MGNNSQNIGDQIRMRRLFFRMSQKQLAKAAKISITTLSKIEGGKLNPRKRVIEVIAKKLSCTYKEELVPNPINISK